MFALLQRTLYQLVTVSGIRATMARGCLIPEASLLNRVDPVWESSIDRQQRWNIWYPEWVDRQRSVHAHPHSHRMESGSLARLSRLRVTCRRTGAGIRSSELSIACGPCEMRITNQFATYPFESINLVRRF